MNILITGAKGFVGKNLVCNLRNFKEGKNRTRDLQIGEIMEYDIDTDPALLDDFCARADFVFNLAGVNRPQTQEDIAASVCFLLSSYADNITGQALNVDGGQCMHI